MKDETWRLRKMGIILLSLALIFSLSTFLLGEHILAFIPFDPTGAYALSGLFAFLGIYCFGGAWRRRNWI